MRRICFMSMLFLFLIPHAVQAQEESQFVISSPADGQVVQGLVTIRGTVSALGFSSYELSFAYDNDPTQTWFPLEIGSEPVFEDDLGTWDTTTLTDGDYSLRLRVFMLDGSTLETTIPGLRVRNYTAVPTSTFTPTATAIAPLFVPPTAQLIAPAPATATLSMPTPTPLPSNPASLQSASIPLALGQGAILALLLFLGFGMLLRLRRE